MKIKMTDLLVPIVAKIIYHLPSVKLERKIDYVKAVMDRNKLLDPIIL